MRKCGHREWANFERYHYLNQELGKQAECYGCYDGEKIIGIIGVIHFPHSRNKKIKSISRLVILPDYQGIGIGKKFLFEVAELYAKKGFEVKITTSAKNLILGLKNDENWKLVRYSQTRYNAASITKNTVRSNVKTATFFFQNV